MKILFLDDSLERRKNFLHNSIGHDVYPAVTALDAIEIMNQEENKWDLICLDHDLGDETYVDSDREDCGMEVARWMTKNKINVGQIIVHTLNHPAGRTMVDLLKKKYENVIKVAFISFDTVVYPVLRNNNG